MIRRRLISYFPLLLLFFSGCDGAGPSHGGSIPGERFRKYWYSGKAEVASYELEQAFPHRILGWEETYKSGFGASAREMTTRARLKEALHIDYWNQNGEEGRVYRRKLGLE